MTGQDFLQRSDSIVDTFVGALERISKTVSVVAEEVQKSRVLTDKLYEEQENAWKECEVALQEDRMIKASRDPWLAGVRYEAQVKSLDEALGRQQEGIATGVQVACTEWSLLTTFRRCSFLMPGAWMRQRQSCCRWRSARSAGWSSPSKRCPREVGDCDRLISL